MRGENALRTFDRILAHVNALDYQEPLYYIIQLIYLHLQLSASTFEKKT